MARSSASVPLLLGALSLGSMACTREKEQAPAPVVMALDETDVAAVQAHVLQTGPTLSGTLSPRRAGTVRAKVSAEVGSVRVDPGQTVEAGELLLRLESQALRQQVSSGRLAVRSARSALEVARLDEERTTRLARAGAIAARDAEAARRARVLQQAQLAEAQGRLAVVEEQLQSTEVRAPFTGVVSERPVSVGDIVQPGAPLVTVIDPSSLVLEGSVPAEEVGALRVGAPVEFQVAGYGDRRFSGAVERINPSVDPVTRQVRVTVALPNQRQALLAGLVAQGRVATVARRVLAIPLRAVDAEAVSPTVVRIREGRAERVEVELGLRDEVAERVEVRRGLSAGDVVALGAGAELAQGTRVKVERAAPPAQGRRR